MELHILPEALESHERIARINIAALTEATKAMAFIDELEQSIKQSRHQDWISAKADRDLLISASELKSRHQIWRLYSNNIHCITLIVEIDDEIFVVDFCSQADLSATEIHLIDTL